MWTPQLFTVPQTLDVQPEKLNEGRFIDINDRSGLDKKDEVCKLVALSVFTMLYSHHRSSFKLFHHPRKTTQTH